MLYAVAVNIGRVRFAISVCRGKEIMRIAQVAMFALLMVCAGAEAGADTLSEIKSSGILKIGYRDDIPPFSEMGPNGPQGFSADLFIQTFGAPSFVGVDRYISHYMSARVPYDANFWIGAASELELGGLPPSAPLAPIQLGN